MNAQGLHSSALPLTRSDGAVFRSLSTIDTEVRSVGVYLMASPYRKKDKETDRETQSAYMPIH